MHECNCCCACNPVSCPNRLVERHVGVLESIGRVQTGCNGVGACAVWSIRSGVFVSVYRGICIKSDEAGRVRANWANAGVLVYVLGVGELAGEAGKLVIGEVVDGAVDGIETLSLSSLLNNPCYANLTVISVRVDSLLSAFNARGGIREGGDVSYDYGEWCASGAFEKLCYCGSVACRGLLPKHE